MSKNDITGDTIKSRGPSKAFDEGFERIFGKYKGPRVVITKVVADDYAFSKERCDDEKKLDLADKALSYPDIYGECA